MGTKMKGLLKGLRYITQKFDEDRKEMEIGYPTDVKHVAHIGWDGPSVDHSPSWMNEFKLPQGCQSAPLNAKGEPKENPEIKWVSQDSGRRSIRSKEYSLTKVDNPELPESSGCPARELSTKPRQSRKNSSTGTKSSRQLKDSSTLGGTEDSSSQSLPDIPKKSRRKKSKESESGGGSTRPSRSSRANDNNITTTGAAAAYTSPNSDPGPDPESAPGSMMINGRLNLL